jgi:hypothetical protein
VTVSRYAIDGFAVVAEKPVIFRETGGNTSIDFRYEKVSVGSKKIR